MHLDEFEKELLNSVEKGEWVSKGNLDKRIKELQSHIINQKQLDDNSLKETNYLLSSPNNRKKLLKSLDELRNN